MIWETMLVGVHVLIAIGLIGFVLLQHGKGADMGAAFGSGSSGSLFGAAGSANFLSRTTAVLAAVFFATSLALTYFSTSTTRTGGGVMQQIEAPAKPAGIENKLDVKPAAPAPSAPAPAVPEKSSEIPK